MDQCKKMFFRSADGQFRMGPRSVPALIGASLLVGLVATNARGDRLITVPKPATKDVVLDRATPPVSNEPTPAEQTVQVAQPSAHRLAALASSLSDLGGALLVESGKAGGNAVVSPLSVASAMGLLQVGANGQTAREIGYLLDSGASGGRRLSEDLPGLLGMLRPTADGVASKLPFSMANRVWIDQRITETVAPVFVSKASKRWRADGTVVPFANPEPSRGVINQWVATQTKDHIKEILPAGSISGNTRFVVTNAIHFKSPWAQPFDQSLTQLKPFKLEGQAAQQVPTMQGERSVSWAKSPNGESVMELPFEGKQYSLLFVVPKEGVSLKEAARNVNGPYLADQLASLKTQNCQVRIPKFKLMASPRSLKGALQGMGMQVPFSDTADFSELIGKKSDAKLDDVFHAASFEIDEAGGEASAATAAVVAAKSFSAAPPECVIDRPFVFALLHKPSGAPLFVGQVVNPIAR